MKSILYTVFACFYLLLTLGINTHIHYCGDKITQVSLLSSNEVSCTCDSLGKMSCCHDAQINVKLDWPSIVVAKIATAKVGFIKIPFFSPNYELFIDLNLRNHSNGYVNDHPPQQYRLIETSVLRI